MFSPLYSLYRSPPVLQPPPGTGPSSHDPDFHTYRATLTQRLEGRAPRLHEALTTLEDAAALLQKDLSRMLADGESSQYVATPVILPQISHPYLLSYRRLVVDLTGAYRPEAQALCVRVASALKVSSEKLMASPGKFNVFRHALL